MKLFLWNNVESKSTQYVGWMFDVRWLSNQMWQTGRYWSNWDLFPICFLFYWPHEGELVPMTHPLVWDVAHILGFKSGFHWWPAAHVWLVRLLLLVCSDSEFWQIEIRTVFCSSCSKKKKWKNVPFQTLLQKLCIQIKHLWFLPHKATAVSSNVGSLFSQCNYVYGEIYITSARRRRRIKLCWSTWSRRPSPGNVTWGNDKWLDLECAELWFNYVPFIHPVK